MTEPDVLNCTTVSVKKMIQIEYYSIKLLKNVDPIACDCNIAWLIRDNPQLLPSILGGTCSNSTPFEDLTSDEYLDCDLTPTDSPSSTTVDSSAHRFDQNIFYCLLVLILVSLY